MAIEKALETTSTRIKLRLFRHKGILCIIKRVILMRDFIRHYYLSKCEIIRSKNRSIFGLTKDLWTVPVRNFLSFFFVLVRSEVTVALIYTHGRF